MDCKGLRMATYYKCDRCHKDTRNRNSMRIVNIPLINHHGRSYPDDDLGVDSKDLCESCINQLHEWVKPLPVEARMK